MQSLLTLMSRSHIVSINNLTVNYSRINNGFKKYWFQNWAKRICEDQNIAQSFTNGYLKDLEGVYKDTAFTYSTVADWPGRLCEGRLTIEDEARIGRPLSSVNDKNTLEESALVEEDPHIKLVEIASAVASQRELRSYCDDQSRKIYRNRRLRVGTLWIAYCMMSLDHTRQWSLEKSWRLWRFWNKTTFSTRQISILWLLVVSKPKERSKFESRV